MSGKEIVPKGDSQLAEQQGKAWWKCAWDSLTSVKRWWNGEITGKRCAKQIIDGAVTTAGACVGGTAGLSISGYIPYSSTFLLTLGSKAGGSIANKLICWLTEEIFDLPPTEAEEKAYAYFDVPRNADFNLIKTKYHKLAKQLHSDRGGVDEEFMKLHNHYAIIRAARCLE